MFPIVVFHNVVSSKSCTDFIKLGAGMGYKTMVITNAQGSAAQRGLPAAQKMAITNKVNFMALSDINDVIELFQPDEILVVAPPPYGKEVLDGNFVSSLAERRWVVVFGGNDPGLSRKDLDKGTRVVQIPAGDIGSIGTLTLGLALLSGKFQFKR